MANRAIIYWRDWNPAKNNQKLVSIIENLNTKIPVFDAKYSCHTEQSTHTVFKDIKHTNTQTRNIHNNMKAYFPMLVLVLLATSAESLTDGRHKLGALQS